MGALRGRANNPSTPKSFTLSHCTLIYISSATLIYYQKVEKRASVKCQRRVGVGVRCPLFRFIFVVVVVVVVLFWVKSAKTTKKETRFLVATWAKKKKKNGRGTETLRQGPHYGLMISQSKTLSIIKGFLVHILRKIKKRHRYWLSPVLISGTRLPYLEDVGSWSNRWHAPPRLSPQPWMSRCAGRLGARA